MKKISTLIFSLFIIFTLQAQESDKQFILLEQFTNTRCGICASKDPAFDTNILDEYEDVEAIHVSYHPSVPYPSDIFYQANKEESDERKDYYGIAGTPRVFVLGTQAQLGSQLLPVDAFKESLGATSPVSIDTKEIFNNDERQAVIDIKTLNPVLAADWRLRVIVVEKVVNYDAPNGLKVHRNIFRKTLTGWDGVAFLPANESETVTFEYDYTLDDSWNADEIYVIAFLQRDDTKEVLNVGSSWGVSEILSIEEEVKLAEPTVKIYPNPVKDILHLKTANLNNFSPIGIQLFNLVGKKVASYDFASIQNNKVSINIADLPRGIYYATIESGTFTTTRKVVKRN